MGKKEVNILIHKCHDPLCSKSDAIYQKKKKEKTTGVKWVYFEFAGYKINIESSIVSLNISN